MAEAGFSQYFQRKSSGERESSYTQASQRTNNSRVQSRQEAFNNTNSRAKEGFNRKYLLSMKDLRVDWLQKTFHNRDFSLEKTLVRIISLSSIGAQNNNE